MQEIKKLETVVAKTIENDNRTFREEFESVVDLKSLGDTILDADAAVTTFNKNLNTSNYDFKLFESTIYATKTTDTPRIDLEIAGSSNTEQPSTIPSTVLTTTFSTPIATIGSTSAALATDLMETINYNEMIENVDYKKDETETSYTTPLLELNRKMTENSDFTVPSTTHRPIVMSSTTTTATTTEAVTYQESTISSTYQTTESKVKHSTHPGLELLFFGFSQFFTFPLHVCFEF